MFYKTFHRRAAALGWFIVDAYTAPHSVAHCFYYKHKHDPDHCVQLMVCCASNKDGTPGKIVRTMIDGREEPNFYKIVL